MEVSPVRAGGGNLHTPSSRRAGRFNTTRAGRYLALGCFFGVVLAHPARAGRYCARTAPSRAPRVALGQVSRHWGRLLPAPMICFLLQCWPAFAQDRAGLVETPDGPLSRKEEWLGPGLGLFASDVVFSKGSLARWGVARIFPRNPNVSLALGWCGGGLQVKRSFQRDTVTLQVL